MGHDLDPEFDLDPAFDLDPEFYLDPDFDLDQEFDFADKGFIIKTLCLWAFLVYYSSMFCGGSLCVTPTHKLSVVTHLVQFVPKNIIWVGLYYAT